MASATDRLERALMLLVDALMEPAVLSLEDTVTVELSHEAGKRFECWLLLGTYQHQFDVADRDTDNPKRFVNLQGVRVMWPIGRMANPRGGSIPRPLPDTVAEIGPQGIVTRPGRVTRIKPGTTGL